MQAYALTDKGRTRSMNQDYIFSSTEPVGFLDNVFILADGMGGHQAGDYASRFVVESLVDWLENRDPEEDESIETLFHQAIMDINSALYEESQKKPEYRGMGTTLVLATVRDNVLYAANIGDSRLYLMRGEMTQVTKDHSYVEELVALGRMERGSKNYMEQKNIITRAVGISRMVKADMYSMRLKCEDTLLLCSDGLSNMIDEFEMEYIIRSEDSLKAAAEALIDAANRNGGKDNISVILLAPQISEVSL